LNYGAVIAHVIYYSNEAVIQNCERCVEERFDASTYGSECRLRLISEFVRIVVNLL